METLAAVASSRWCVEQLLEEAKGDVGLDEYEVRYWHSWYRHITLSMVAHTWLTLLRHEERKKTPPSLAHPQLSRATSVAEYSLAYASTQRRFPLEVAGVAETKTVGSNPLPLPNRFSI